MARGLRRLSIAFSFCGTGQRVAYKPIRPRATQYAANGSSRPERKYLSRNLVLRYAVIPAVTAPAKYTPSGLPDLNSVGTSSTPAARITGVASRNDSRAEEESRKPATRPAGGRGPGTERAGNKTNRLGAAA